MKRILNRSKLVLSKQFPLLYGGIKKAALAVQSLLTKDSPQEIIFTRIYKNGGWGNRESLSGIGSTLQYTENIRRELPKILEDYNVGVLLDIPCGDFYWMQTVDFGTAKYIGADIVNDLVTHNAQFHSAPNRVFKNLDLLKSSLPESDLILCRDCLPHLPVKEIVIALKNIKSSGAHYLLMSHYPECVHNEDIMMGRFRRINFELSPFSFPPPLFLISEYYDAYKDKSLAMWRVADIPAYN